MVVENGSGRGAMTGLLSERVSKVVAIEIDPALAGDLRAAFAGKSQVTVMTQDFLSVDLRELLRQQGVRQCFVFGNLPYYITSPILHHLFAFQASIRSMGLLMQQEVARRLTAQPGCREYGYLTVLTRFHWLPRIAFAVPPGAFSPPPKVHSMLVTFAEKPQGLQEGLQQTDEFLSFVKHCFAQKRKNLANNLSRHYSRERVARMLAATGMPDSVRAEQLSLEELALVHSFLSSNAGCETLKSH